MSRRPAPRRGSMSAASPGRACRLRPAGCGDTGSSCPRPPMLGRPARRSCPAVRSGTPAAALPGRSVRLPARSPIGLPGSGGPRLLDLRSGVADRPRAVEGDPGRGCSASERWARRACRKSKNLFRLEIFGINYTITPGRETEMTDGPSHRGAGKDRCRWSSCPTSDDLRPRRSAVERMMYPPGAGFPWRERS